MSWFKRWRLKQKQMQCFHLRVEIETRKPGNFEPKTGMCRSCGIKMRRDWVPITK